MKIAVCKNKAMSFSDIYTMKVDIQVNGFANNDVVQKYLYVNPENRENLTYIYSEGQDNHDE